jgi:hypothetical protein
MAVYNIFPEKDTFIWSQHPTQNMGIDEILEVSTYNDPSTVDNLSLIPSVTRAIVKFPQSQIDYVIDNIINEHTSSHGTTPYTASFQLFLANASALPQTYTLECYAVSESWTMGTGRLADLPITTNGASWKYNGPLDTNDQWVTSSFQTNVTASDNGIQRGGANWFITPYATQSFDYTSNKDTNFNVTEIVKNWHSHSIHGGITEAFGNEGFIVKYTGSQEFNTASIQQLSFFSMDTHTIYPPQLQIKWDDSSYNIGGGTVISTVSQSILTIGNNQTEIQETDVYRFRIYCRDQFPARSFQTSSVYLNNKFLPTSSYWALKDLKTEEIVVDFDTNNTKVSADPTSNYFDVYMNGLEPERYYQIMIKTIIGAQTLVFENPGNYFKLVR